MVTQPKDYLRVSYAMYEDVSGGTLGGEHV